MPKSQFVYVTYIRTTPEKLWQALTVPEFTERYWIQTRQESDWKAGSLWRVVAPDGNAIITGQVLEIDHPRRLVLSWRGEKTPEQKAEGYTPCTYNIEQLGASVKFTVQHEVDVANSVTIAAVSGGWPLVLASLKSLLETGEPLEQTRTYMPCAPSSAVGTH